MRVEYPVNINGKNITISKECSNDLEAFEFMYHMDELYGDTVCVRPDPNDDKKVITSDRVKLNIRVVEDKKKKKVKYYELVCNDRRESKEECLYAKRKFGIGEEGDKLYLFPKNYLEEKGEDGPVPVLDKNGNKIWRPWTKFDKELDRDN